MIKKIKIDKEHVLYIESDTKALEKGAVLVELVYNGTVVSDSFTLYKGNILKFGKINWGKDRGASLKNK